MKLLGLFAAFLLVLFSPHSSVACLWDRDTIREEAEGNQDAIAVISGRFDRHPPKYYEMRLERVSRELASDPARLDLYDDAGVACDRLHRGDEAIAWMEKKRGRLDELPESESRAAHLYRYHANLGTFLAHRWLRDGAPDGRISELEQARDEIARAIEINPDAHFGREKYQLMALEWLIESRNLSDEILVSTDRSFLPADQSSDAGYKAGALPGTELDGAIEGLSGLIRLGDAWESVDVFYSLQRALQLNSDAALAYLAHLRIQELMEAGATSLYPISTTKLPFEPVYELEDSEAVEEFYILLRAEAKTWSRARLIYQEERFAKGLHPDTSSDFWIEFSYTGIPPELPGERFRPWYVAIVIFGGAGIGLVIVLVLIVRLFLPRDSRRF